MMITERKNISLISASLSETITAGQELGSLLENGDVVALTGPLGAGKTCFVKGIAGGLNIADNEISSPSFVLLKEYRGSMPLFHFDLYRMNDISELYNIGWDDYFMRDGVVVVEWGEKAGELLPETGIRIMIDIISERERTIKITFGSN
jgi:tRNA threonylcarbamoyladenosine biosynthesis protein TsaE